MGLQYFQPSQGSSPPRIEQMLPTSAVTLTLGEPIQRNSSDPEQIEAHAGASTVTGIVGTALGAVTSGTPDGPTTKIPVARADTVTLWLANVYDVSASAVATVVAATHEGVKFGMIEISNNWYVDEEDTTDVVLIVEKVSTRLNTVLFRWLTDAIAGDT